MADDVLKSFLIAIGYKEDAASRKKMTDGLAKVEKAVASLSLALVAATTAATAAAVKMAASFEDLFYASQRTGASINNLRGLAYAVSQLGGSYGGAVQSLEAFAKNIRTNPGYESMARKLGVATRENGKLRDTVDILTDLGRVFKGQRYEIAYQYAQALGLDEKTFQLLRDQPDALRRYRDEYERTTKALGTNTKEMTEQGKALSQSWRSFLSVMEALSERIAATFFPIITKLLDYMREWVVTHGPQINAFWTQVGQGIEVVERAAKSAYDTVEPFVTLIAKKLSEGFNATGGAAETLKEMKQLFSDIGDMVKRAYEYIVKLIQLVGLDKVAAALGAGIKGGFRESDWTGASGMPDWSGGKVGPSASDYAGGGGMPEAPRTGKGALAPYKRGLVGRAVDWFKGGRPSIRKGYQAGGTGAEGGSKAEIRGGTFTSKAPGVMRRLMEDFGLTKEEAGVVLGNLGHESAGFTAFEEGGNGPGRGWAQWTDPGRKKRFFQYAKDRGLDPKSDEANYGFLKWELENTHRSSISGLKNAQTFGEKMRIFEERFEGAGVKAYGSRNRYAARAIAAFDAEEERGAESAKKRPAVDPDRMRTDFDSGPLNRKYDFSRSPTGAGAAAPLGSGPIDNSTRSFTQTNKTEIVVQGGGDPQATANAVAGAQSRVHEMSLRNAQGAVR